MQIIMNEAFDTTVILNSGFNVINNVAVSADSTSVMMGGGSGIDAGDMGEGMPSDNGGSVLSSWGFVGGITGATLIVSIVLGILLAKKRIKKGFDLYED
ncbi:hypothetical protein [Clostridium sp. Marseille-P299]|uniref:hypothetical protein n=1 Tax=Clostridium sp. Marseille-P299 TaxID=1805477 RepID=UPI00082C585A|nr:hypothetical protein [Clostridium sp. Marseille-P299]